MSSDFGKIRQEIATSLDIPVSEIERISHLTPMQRDIYTDLMIHSDSIVYSLGASIRLHTELDRELWEKAVSMATMEEEVTRTRFILYKGEPFQFVDRNCPVYFEFIDLTAPDARMNDFEEVVREKVFVTYDLDNDPQLFKNFLVKDADGHYVPLVAMPHLLFDGYSAKLFFERIGRIYEALAGGDIDRKKGGPFHEESPLAARRSPLAPRPSFYDHAEESLSSFDTPEIQEYWQNLLSRVEPLGFHTEFGKDGKLTSKTVVMAGDELQEIKAYCEAGRWSLPAYFRALYGILANRYADPSEDFVIYDIVSGRPEAHKQTSGCFYQVLPILFPKRWFGLGISLPEYLEYVKGYRRSLGSFQNISVFSQKRILKADKPGFFHNFINFPRVNVCGETVNMSLHDLPPDDQVHFIINDEGERLALTVHYNEKFFSDGPNFLERIRSLSRQIVRGCHLQELDILLEPERHKLLIEWNDTRKPFPDDKCIHHLFEEQVERTPDATAVVFEDQHLIYGELNARANQLAHHLQASGVGPEVLVGICVERSLEMIVGLLGILKAGGAYVPLDPAYPLDRLTFMLEDSQTPVLLTQAHLKEKLPGHRTRICLDSDWGGISQESEYNPASGVTSENLAYIFYTSGSTGKPKGVMIEHYSVLTLLCGFEQIAPSDKQLTGAVVCPFGFDVSVWEMFSMLCFGGTVHILIIDIFSSAEHFVSYLFDHNITSAYIPPALLLATISQLEKLTGHIVLNRILVGVEPIKEGILQRFRNLSDQIHIVNGYGPTEATICATFFYFGTAVDIERNTPIGRAVPHYQVYLVNPNLRLVPIGVPGELYIGGVGLARGYLNRPELTAEKFIPNPFSHDPGTRLYKTGDLARYLPDGNIEFLGRIDHQVKIRGFRIELGEIEAVLSQHSDVRDAVVIVRESRNGDKYLAACIVSNLVPDRIPYQSTCTIETDEKTIKVQTDNLSSGGVCLAGAFDDFVRDKVVRLALLLPGESRERWLKGKMKWRNGHQVGVQFDLIPAEETLVRQSVRHLLESQDLLKFLHRTLSGSLRTYLRQRLPDHMIPTGFIFLDALPLTPNGKVDRRALTKTGAESRAQEEYVAPHTPTEKTLTAIWSEVLGLEQIGIHDNFFKLGGHSLLIIQVVSRVREAFQTDLILNSMFETPTVAQLAGRIDLSCWINQDTQSPSEEVEEFVL